jgi:hypothetical protein
MDSFYRTFFYPITYIVSPLSTNHIPSCFGSRVDMVSNLDLVSMIFALSLFNNYLATSVKWLDDSTINVHRNYDGFCIRSALR